MANTGDVVDYRDWIGSEEVREERADLAPVRRLLVMLDDTETTFADGDTLPALWHWLYFLPEAPQSQLGPDGHPRRGGFLPPVVLPRRMFAGAQIRFHAAIAIGAALRLEARVTNVEAKSGRSGDLVFVTVENRILADGALAVEETQNIVYREAGDPVPAPPSVDLPPAPAGSWSQTITADPVLLFRFSALTFNGHRIHYDRIYATGEEGYPGLIVHGPLIAMALMDLVRRNAGRPVTGYRFRAQAPIFDGAPFRVTGVAENSAVTLTAERCDGTAAMTAEATLG